MRCLCFYKCYQLTIASIVPIKNIIVLVSRRGPWFSRRNTNDCPCGKFKGVIDSILWSYKKQKLLEKTQLIRMSMNISKKGDPHSSFPCYYFLPRWKSFSVIRKQSPFQRKLWKPFFLSHLNWIGPSFPCGGTCLFGQTLGGRFW